MTKLGLLFVFAIAPLLGAAEPAANDQALLEKILAAQKTVETVQGRFTQRSSNTKDSPDEVFVLKAVFAIKQPDHFNLTYTKPGDDGWRERICSDGKTRWDVEILFTGDEPTVSKKTVDPNDDQDPLRRVAAFFKLDRAELEKEFSIVAEKREGGSRLTLTPVNPGLAEQIAKIVVELDGEMRTSQVQFEDQDGNRIVLTIDEAVYNKPIADEEFVYKPKP